MSEAPSRVRQFRSTSTSFTQEIAQVKTSPLQVAEAAVMLFEAIPPGQPFADALGTAKAAIAALRADATNAISRFEPFGADAIADYNFLIESGIKKQEFTAALLAILPIALEQHPRLARLLLSPAVLIRVREIAPMDGELECIAYLQECAAMLLGRAEFEPAASWLVASVTLADRCAAHEERHEAHLSREQARITPEPAAAVA